MHTSTSEETGSVSTAVQLIPIMMIVFSAFLIIGMAMPVLPLHVHEGLGLGATAVGIVAGSQFAASLLSRITSGQFSDTRGAKPSVLVGMVAAACAGGLYLTSLGLAGKPLLSLTVLVVGRAVLGAGESFIITGALSWGLMLAGPKHTGKVIAWIGTAMYGAFAVGAPIGSALYSLAGFKAIALATALIPLVTLLLVLPLRAVRPSHRPQANLFKVASAVWLPGIGLAFSSLGFGAVTAFITLLFVEQSWDSSWLAFTVFAGAFMSARICLGHLSDKHGGARIALIFLVIEVIGLAAIWLAPNAAVALLGAALSGFGYSLVYPAFGVEAVKMVPPESRGLAMGAYTAFLDMALGIGSPLLGFIGSHSGMPNVFLASAIGVACALFVGVALRQASLRQQIRP